VGDLRRDDVLDKLGLLLWKLAEKLLNLAVRE
jgi:hypothetical protein